MLSLAKRIPLYTLRYNTGWPKVLPLSLAICLTERCNSRCKTCRIYEDTSCELSKYEFERIFKSFGKCLYWVTLTGGEPFLRDDIEDIFLSLYLNCRPKIINIATNGFFTEAIVDKTKRMSKAAKGSFVILNLSIDEIGQKHDQIRCCADSYKRVLSTFHSLRSLKIPNLILGVNTTISKFNLERLPLIISEVNKIGPDSYIAEIADNRVELKNIGFDLIDSRDRAISALNLLKIRQDFPNRTNIPKLIRAFRAEYYELAKNYLEGKFTLPCYAGIASVHLSNKGSLWSCPVKAREFGNLRDADYDFKRVWFGKNADRVRREIKEEKCFCSSANVNYTNLLCNIVSLLKISKKVIYK